MILQDDWNARGKRGQCQYLPRETQTVHVKSVWRQLAKQIAQPLAPPIRRRRVAEWLKVVMHTGTRQTFRMRTRLDNRYANAGSGCGFGDIDQRRPRVQQLPRRASFGIIEEADLYDVQQWARHDGHKLMARGSH